MTYKAITINGEPKLEPVNPFSKFETPVKTTNLGQKQHINYKWEIFNRNNPPIPYIGPAIPDGTILDESEVEIKGQYIPLSKKDEWFNVKDEFEFEHFKARGCKTRRVATLKAREPEPDFDQMRRDRATSDKSDQQAFLDKIKKAVTPSNSEEGEQPMKEEIGIDELIDSIHVDKANFDYISSSPTQKINGTLRSEIKRIIKLALTKK